MACFTDKKYICIFFLKVMYYRLLAPLGDTCLLPVFYMYVVPKMAVGESMWLSRGYSP